MTQKSTLIFTKIPIAGLVKTRLSLSTCLSNEEVALLAEAMLKDTLILVSKTDTDRIEIGYYPEKDLRKLTDLVSSTYSKIKSEKEVVYYPQYGSNFDEKFSSVVNRSFENNTEYLVILGGDLPYLNPRLINYAFKHLSIQNKKERIVLGPANGGGIYLVGLTHQFNPEWFIEFKLFRGGVEMLQYISFCKKKEIELIILPPMIDIDIEEDLVSLITFIKAIENAETNKYYYYPRYTAKIVNKLGIYIEEIPGETRKRRIRKGL